MKAGYLSDYFDGIAAKRLSRVEIDPDASHQHEFQGITDFKNLFGTPDGKKKYPATFVRLFQDDDPEIGEYTVTLYDGRKKKDHRTSEYRIYYPVKSEPLVHSSNPDDLLVVAKQKNDNLLIIIADANSTYEQQLIWLFGLSEFSGELKEVKGVSEKEIGFAARLILESIGIDSTITDETWLELILSEFGETFPSTYKFSNFARKTLPEVKSIENPDKSLIRWIEHEEMLFRTLERHIVSKRLEQGFDDVDNFVSYSLGVQNRRKSRVGHALEHHVEHIFIEHGIKYSRGAETENKTKPDFIFPGIKHYSNPKFQPSCLTMLGVKTTCKDRWRQVLSEAKRINQKHLFTLEPGISENQTNEMKANSLSLVLPKELHQSYSDSQKNELLNLNEFLILIKEKETACL